MNKRKIINYIFLVIAIISFIVLQYFILKLDIIPKTYYLLFTCIEVFILLIAGVFSFLKKKVFYITSIVLSVLLIIVNSFGYYYIKHLDKFIDDGFTGDIISLSTYYLISSSNNEVTSIDDVTLDKTIYYYTHSMDNEKAREKLGNYIYEPVEKLSDYLNNNTESKSYLLIDKVNYNFYTELDFEHKDSYKVVYEFDIEKVEKRNLEVKDVYNIFLVGKDFWGRDDLNLIITINNRTHEVLLTGMTRDLYIDAVGYGFKDSLTGMYVLGEDVVIKSLENFFDITIDYKITVYTENLVDIVDNIGGIEFCSPIGFRTTHAKVLGTYDDTKGEKMYVPKGCRSYNGIEILTIARERKAFNPKGDHQRQENCRQILITIAKKLASMSTLSNYGEVLDSLNGLFQTNMNRNTMALLVRNALEGIEYTVDQSYVGGEQSWREPLGIERWPGPAIYPNTNDANNARAKLQEIINK